ncbi:hypothetical protein JCM11641_001362 [Rhodosporidiobolus odoratus]
MFAAARASLRSAVPVARRAASSSAAGAKSSPYAVWNEPAAYPIFVTVGLACFGAGWYLTRLARSPDIIWDRHNNPTPWNKVEQGTLTKMFTNQPDKGAPLSPMSLTAPGVSEQQSVRAALAAALLALGDPSLPIHTSALLAPFRHLLAVRPASPSLESVLTSPESFKYVVADQQDEVDGPQGFVRPGAYSARGSNAGSEYGGGIAGQRGSVASSMMWTSAGQDGPAPPPPLQLDPEEEERLADEWGLSKALSTVEDDIAAGSSAFATPAQAWELDNLAGIGLRRFPTATAMSEAGLLDQERKAEALAEAAAGEDMEILETKSMPDLDRPRSVSFADAVLTGLDLKLEERAAIKAMRGVAEEEDEAQSEGGFPRIKIIERSPTERRLRARAQSVGPELGLSALPTFSDLAAVASGPSSTGMSGGIASRDSLFLSPSARAQSSVGTLSGRRNSTFSAQGSRRGSFDALSAIDAPESRLSIAIPSGFSSGPRSPISPTSPASPNSAFPPRPSTSLSCTTTPIEPSTPGFTSRFDPMVIAAQRAELLKDRPQFQNEDGGKPPKVVLMPAPLAGRPPSPIRKERKEGPNSEGEDEEEEEEEEEPEEQEDDKPQRPAGALYGRSLMDVIAERKAVQKGKSRAYVPGTDGRRSMFDWKETSPAAAEALARLEGQGGELCTEEKEDDVPLALVPAGGAHRKQQIEEDSHQKQLARIAKSKSHVSIFGPDLIYQRELAAAKEVEDEERRERERMEEVERAKEEKRRRKEEKRKSKGKLRRKSQGALPAMETSTVWQSREREEYELTSEVVEDRYYPAFSAAYPPHPPSPPGHVGHSVAPSLSIPTALTTARAASLEDGDWFRPASPPVKLTNDSDDEEEDEFYKPRPISSLAHSGLLSPPEAGRGRPRISFGSESSDENRDEEDQPIRSVPAARTSSRLSLPFPGETSADLSLTASILSPTSTTSGHLPLPGQPSSVGHGGKANASIAETEDDRPLGVRYSRQSLAFSLDPQQDDEDEDEEPLARRYSRLSLGGTLDLSAVESSGERLGLDFGGGEKEWQEELEGGAGSEDEDDKPLGARFSVMPAGSADEDDVPLAFRRLSLAPSAVFAQQQYPTQVKATLRALDDDGQTVHSEDSDDKPLGLKAAAATNVAFPQAQSGFFPPPSVPFAGAPYNLPFAPSMPLFFPPAAAAGYPFAAASGMPMPMPMQMGAGGGGQDSMGLALAQMQMHAAMQQQQTVMEVGGAVGGPVGGPQPGENIERWRRGVF